jgi:hypothetical protein
MPWHTPACHAWQMAGRISFASSQLGVGVCQNMQEAGHTPGGPPPTQPERPRRKRKPANDRTKARAECRQLRAWRCPPPTPGAPTPTGWAWPTRSTQTPRTRCVRCPPPPPSEYASLSSLSTVQLPRQPPASLLACSVVRPGLNHRAVYLVEPSASYAGSSSAYWGGAGDTTPAVLILATSNCRQEGQPFLHRPHTRHTAQGTTA